MSAKELREKYREVFGEPSRSGNKNYLFRKIAWKIQEQEYGGLSERALRRALEIADEGDIRVRPPRDFKVTVDDTQPAKPQKPEWDPRLPMPGTVLEKIYKGQNIEVTIHGPKDFEYEGRRYTSLTAISREITGTNYNGWVFFGLKKKGRGQ